MKLATFIAGNETRWGAVRGDTVVDLNLARAFYLASRGLEAKYLARDMLNFIQQGEEARDAAEETLEHLGSRRVDGIMFPASAAKILAPIANPSKVVAVGLNYWDHIREHGGEPPAYPVLFPKFPSAIIGPGESIASDQALTQQLDYEAELAIIIGKRARRVAAADALDHIFGYCNLNDVSARDLQFDPKGSGQWSRGKCLDTYCPIGPHIVTRDEIADPQNLKIQSILNGVVMQNSNTREMVNGVAKLIEFITQGITLLPGDIIATGTPDGVGHYRKPPVYMKSGDIIEIEIEGLGRLTNPVK
jgi:2-keto-4-pentenoate hydratase/2-oxohepta-3-ene-1,7-dioic acid hydratase in catechol pathway